MKVFEWSPHKGMMIRHKEGDQCAEICIYNHCVYENNDFDPLDLDEREVRTLIDALSVCETRIKKTTARGKCKSCDGLGEIGLGDEIDFCSDCIWNDLCPGCGVPFVYISDLSKCENCEWNIDIAWELAKT